MKVFWSWQSDTPEDITRHFVKAALLEAIQLASRDLDLSEADRPKLDHDTKGELGLVSIVDTIFKKIEAATVFVGDVTFVGETLDGKKLPNPNVMIELGHAITSIGTERIILVQNKAFGGRPEDLPFDLRHRRGPIRFDLPKGTGTAERKKIQSELAKELAGILAACLGDALEKRSASIVYPMHPSRADDRSSWLQTGEKIRHHNFFGDPGEYEWTVTEAPRSYMRIVPANYERALSLREIQTVSTNSRFMPLGPNGNADGGVNDLGIVMVGFAPRGTDTVMAATQWFGDTGEIWGFNGAATFDRRDELLVAYDSIPREWWTFMDRAWDFLDKVGVKGPFKVEAGVCGLKKARWGVEMERSYGALKNEVFLNRVDTRWDSEARIEFLYDINNRLRDAYNQSKLDIERFVQQYIPNFR